MKATDLKIGSFYEIKGQTGPWNFQGRQYKKNIKSAYGYGSYAGYILVFKNDKGETFEKTSAAGVKEVVNPVPKAKNTKSILPKHNDYDRLAGYTELVATFLRTIDIEGGVVDVEHEGLIVPTVFVFPSYVNRLQELIKKVNLNNLTMETNK